MTTIDHFMYAVPDLDEGIEWAAKRFDARPVYGGPHVGLGTRNALISLGETYLELIAPDPAQSLDGTFGERIGALSSGGLVTWAARGDLAAIAAALAALDLPCRGPQRVERRAEDAVLVWDLLFPQTTGAGGRMPFFIDWLDCAHPSVTNPVGGEFRSLSITTPDPDPLRAWLGAAGLELPVTGGPPDLSVTIETGRGQVTLATTEATVALRMR